MRHLIYSRLIRSLGSVFFFLHLYICIISLYYIFYILYKKSFHYWIEIARNAFLVIKMQHARCCTLYCTLLSSPHQRILQILHRRITVTENEWLSLAQRKIILPVCFILVTVWIYQWNRNPNSCPGKPGDTTQILMCAVPWVHYQSKSFSTTVYSYYMSLNYAFSYQSKNFPPFCLFLFKGRDRGNFADSTFP